MLGDDAECTEALIDEVGIHAFTVVGTDELVPPAAECRQAEAAQTDLPRTEESWVGGTDPKLDPTALACSGGDRRIGIRHQLGDDLREVDPRLREVLAKVAPPDTAVTQLRCVDRHGQRISRRRGQTDAFALAG